MRCLVEQFKTIQQKKMFNVYTVKGLSINNVSVKGGVSQMLTLANKGGEGGVFNIIMYRGP